MYPLHIALYLRVIMSYLSPPFCPWQLELVREELDEVRGQYDGLMQASQAECEASAQEVASLRKQVSQGPGPAQTMPPPPSPPHTPSSTAVPS